MIRAVYGASNSRLKMNPGHAARDSFVLRRNRARVRAWETHPTAITTRYKAVPRGMFRSVLCGDGSWKLKPERRRHSRATRMRKDLTASRRPSTRRPGLTARLFPDGTDGPCRTFPSVAVRSGFGEAGR